MTAQPSAGTERARKLTMDERQQLDSDAIYRLNSALEQIRGLAGISADVPLLPAQLHKIRRGFQWMGVNARNWQWSEELLVKVQQALRLLIDEKGEFKPGMKDELESLWHEEINGEAARKLVQLRKDWTRILTTPANRWKTFDPEKTLHRSLLELAGGRVTDGAKNIDGLVLKKIKGNRRVKYIYNRLLHENSTSVDPPSEYECLYFGKTELEAGWYEQRPGVEYPSRPKKWKANYLKQPEHWLVKLHAALLDYDPGSVQGLISIPVYDAGQANDPWGRLVGIVHVLVTKQNEKLFATEKKRARIINRFLRSADRLPQVFRAIGRAEAAGAPVDRSRSKNGLTAQHFLKRLPCFHDWQHVRVRPLDGHDGEDECWGRPLEGPGGWKRAPGTQCEHGERKGLPVLLNGLNNLLDLPWANPRDLAELGRLEFEFELPDYTLLPDRGDGRDAIVRQYQHELLDILRLVLPKVQRHRYAVRNAAVAIMSRNMSHNIGSHVLATVAGEREPDDFTAGFDQRNLLLRYLQERMDFIAELATTKSYLSLPLRFAEIFESLTPGESAPGVPKGQKLLLDTICAVNNRDRKRAPLIVNLSYLPDETIAVDLPGGRHGLQALYVILENVARNSAKHRKAPPDRSVIIRVRLDEQDSNEWDWKDDSLLRVRIWDDAGNAQEVEDKQTKPNWERINRSVRDESIVDAQGGLRPGNWGLRELAIAAAYLRGVDLEDFETFPGQPSLLRAWAMDDEGCTKGNRRNIGYEFFLRRPQHVLVNHSGPIDGVDDRKLARVGIAVRNLLENDRVEHRYLLEPRNSEANESLPVRRLQLNEKARSQVYERMAADADRGTQSLREWTSERWLAKLREKHSKADARASAVRLYYGNSATLPGGCGERCESPDPRKLGSHAVFDHHHFCGGLDLDTLEGAFFFEVYDNHCDQRLLVEEPGANREALQNELLAAAISRIMILDERVQEESSETQSFGRTVPVAWGLERRRILVPSINQAPLRSEATWRQITAYVDEAPGELDFLVVHLGILERLSDSLDEAMARIRVTAAERAAELVICSGRGAPPQVMREQIRFAPLSSILHWTVHRPSKLHLYELLCSARSPYV